MLRAVVRRGCGVSPNLLRVGNRCEAFGDCTSSSLSVNEVVSSRGTGLALVDRCSENGVLGFGLGSFGRPSSSRSSWERLTHIPLERSNAVLPGSWSHSAPRQLSHVRGFIQLKTNLEVADNSGAKRVQCIKVMKGSNAAKIGDIIMASVKDAQPRGKVKKGEVVTCVVVRAATQKLRRDGSEIKFDKNAVVLVNKQGEPIGTRIFGPVPHELRRRKLVKILTLADYVA